MNFWGIINLKLLLDVLFAVGFGLLLFSRVKEQRTLWLLRGYLFLVSSAWFIQRYAYLPLTSKLIDAVVLACSLSLAILWQGELRRLMELINLFATDTPLHDGAVLVKGNKIISAGVILPLSRQGISRYGTRHLAALGITERFDRCICIVVSEETGTLSLANQGKLERPITSSRLQELLAKLIGNQNSMGANKAALTKNVSFQKTDSSDNIISDINKKESEKSEIFINKKD